MRRPRHSFAKKSLGQNFLVDTAIVDRILAAFELSKDDVVLEIGPGRGALTERLVRSAGHVYAVEFDRDLAPMLREKFADAPNFTLIEGDVLESDFSRIDGSGRKLRLIANLPYNISTALLQRLFDDPNIFSDAVLMFQLEVVERITAPPGTKDRGFLTVLTEAYFHVRRLFDVPPEAFRPVPKVWSSVVHLQPKPPISIDRDAFRHLVSTSFAQKRKTIHNNLKALAPDIDDALATAGIAPNRRAETLTLDEWLHLADALR